MSVLFSVDNFCVFFLTLNPSRENQRCLNTVGAFFFFSKLNLYWFFRILLWLVNKPLHAETSQSDKHVENKPFFRLHSFTVKHSTGFPSCWRPPNHPQIKQPFESLTMSIYRERIIIFYMVKLQQKGDSTRHHFSKFILFSYFNRPHNIPFPPSIQPAWAHFFGLFDFRCS